MKKWSFISIIFISVFSFGQTEFQDLTTYYLLNVGYTYQGANYFTGGGEVYLVTPNNNIWDLGAAVDLGAPKGKFTAIPKAHAGFLFNKKGSSIDPYSANFNSAFWLIRANVSPWHVEPEVGISVLSLLELTAGYGFEFKEHDYANLKGVKIGVNLKLPLLLFWHD